MSTPSTGTSVPEPRVLQAARAGDQHAFGRLIEPHQGELLAHCCYADEPIDATKVAAVFERAGLPGRLD